MKTADSNYIPNPKELPLPQRDLNSVEVLVEVTMPQLETRVSEEAWELDILKAVSTAAPTKHWTSETCGYRNMRTVNGYLRVECPCLHTT